MCVCVYIYIYIYIATYFIVSHPYPGIPDPQIHQPQISRHHMFVGTKLSDQRAFNTGQLYIRDLCIHRFWYM